MSINHLKKLGMVGRNAPAPQPVSQTRLPYKQADGWRQWADEDSDDLYAEADRYSGDSLAEDEGGHAGRLDEEDEEDDLGDDSDLADLDFDLKAQTEVAKKEIKAEEERERQRIEAERRQREEEERRKLEAEVRAAEQKRKEEEEMKRRVAEEINRQAKAEEENKKKTSSPINAAGDTVNSIEVVSRKENSEK